MDLLNKYVAKPEAAQRRLRAANIETWWKQDASSASSEWRGKADQATEYIECRRSRASTHSNDTHNISMLHDNKKRVMSKFNKTVSDTLHKAVAWSWQYQDMNQKQLKVYNKQRNFSIIRETNVTLTHQLVLSSLVNNGRVHFY